MNSTKNIYKIKFIRKKHIKKYLLALALLLQIGALPTRAAEIIPYSADQFKTNQESGDKIVLQYHASWCPVCKKQRNSLSNLVNDPAFKKLRFIAADYDSEKELKSKYNVKGQSTLILFNGSKETTRNQGVTDEADLKKFIMTLTAQK